MGMAGHIGGDCGCPKKITAEYCLLLRRGEGLNPQPQVSKRNVIIINATDNRKNVLKNYETD